jgi:hypothetical protein
LFALAMTAADVSAMGISNVECATRLRKATARQALHVQSKRMIYLCIGSPEERQPHSLGLPPTHSYGVTRFHLGFSVAGEQASH